MTPQKNIEEFFLHSLLRISFAGIILVIGSDYLFQQNFFWHDGLVDLSIFVAVVISYILFRLNHFNSSVIIITSITLVSMIYQSLELPDITTMSFSVILVVGFIYSILLKGFLNRLMHGITVLAMIVVFAWQATHTEYYLGAIRGEVITMGVTYLALYAIICYTAGYIKIRYDAEHQELISMNSELIDKANEIETQNEELLQGQQNLYELNLNLERMVHERTEKIKEQNEQLINYSYTNAHHLRGPVARVLGLIQVSKLEDSLDHAFLFQKIEEQTFEIDAVVRRINDELDREEIRK